MKITLELDASEAAAIADYLLAAEAGESCPPHCAAIARLKLVQIVGQAVVAGGLQHPAADRVVERDYARYQRTRKLPPSHRAGPGGRA